MVQFTIDTSIPIQFEEIEQLEDSRFTKVKIWLCHTGKNRNNSYFEKSVIEKAIPSLINIPVLGFIKVDNQNEADFTGHEERIIIDNDGVRLEYMGRAYGMIPETNNAKFENKICEDGVTREFLTVEGLLWNKFKEAIDIFDRDEEKSQSMELDPNSISGSFDNTGVYKFSNFMFEGACILGEGITPAMAGSVIEKFSKSKIQNQFQEMITEFNNKFSEYINRSHNDNDGSDSNTEGGNKVDEKLELIQKYSLNEDQLKGIQDNLEKFSLDELKVELEKLVEGNKQKDFATAAQLQEEIRNALSKKKRETDWGEARAFWYIDHDESRVYAEDVEDNWHPVGMNYSMNGDFVVIDFDSKKKIKFVPMDMEGDETTNFELVSKERKDFEVSEEIKKKDEEISEVSGKFENTKTELQEKSTELETLQTQFNEQKEKLDSFESMTDYEKIKSQNEVLSQEIETLKQFKKDQEVKEKMDVIEKFTQLTEEDVKPFKDELDKYSKDDLEDKLFAIVGRKGLNFSKDDVSSKDLKVHLSNFKQSDPNKPEWAELVEQYKNKQ